MSLRFKRHYKLVLALVLVSALLVLGLGDQRIVAYVAPGNEQMAAGVNTLARWLAEDLLAQPASLAWVPGLLDLLYP